MRSTGYWVAVVAALGPLAACSEPEAPAGGLILQKIAGDAQTFVQGRTLPDTIVVKVTGSGLTGLFVSFTVTGGGGSVTEAVVTPDAAGLARTVWTLGPGTGRNELVAFSPGQLLTFTATATPAGTSPDTMVAQGSPPVQWPVNDTVRAAVRVLDVAAVPVAGDTVIFSVTGGGGDIGGTGVDTVLTDAAGVAQSHPWRLGTLVGSNTLSAASVALTRKGQAPVLFTVGSTPLAARRLGVRTMPSVGVSGVRYSFFSRPVLEVRDSFDNVVPGNGALVTATLTSAPPGTKLVGKATATAAIGVATFDTLVVFGPPGSVTLRFATPGLDSIQTGAIGLTVGPASIYTSTLTVSPTTVMAGGTAVVTVTVRDDFGTPVSGFRPGFVTSNPDSIGDVPPTDGQGQTSAVVFTPALAVASGRTDANDRIRALFSVSDTTLQSATLQILAPGGSLSFLVQPQILSLDVVTPAPEVQVLDSTGALMSAFGGQVQARTFNRLPAGTYTATAVNGVAVFPSIVAGTQGFGMAAQRLWAENPGLYGVRSDFFNAFSTSDEILTVSVTGSGTGSVLHWIGNDDLYCWRAGQATGGNCMRGISANGNVYTLDALPAPGSVFMGWSGACGGVGVCQVTNNGSSMTVTATFE